MVLQFDYVIDFIDFDAMARIPYGKPFCQQSHLDFTFIGIIDGISNQVAQDNLHVIF